MNEFDSYTELVLSKNRSEDANCLQLAFWDRKQLWQKAKELNMSVSDMRECEAASSHYEEDKKAAAAAEKARKAAEKKAAAQKAAAEKKAAEEAAAVERKAAAEKAAAEKAAKEAEKRKAREAILPLAELLEEGLVKFPEGELYIGKTQVTQALWKFITGEEPSHFKGDDRPVESVSIGDCEKFIAALNARPEVKKAKFKFRLPTQEEWNKTASESKDLNMFSPFEKSEVKHIDELADCWVEKGTKVATVRSSTGRTKDVVAPHSSVWHPVSFNGKKDDWFGYFRFMANDAVAWTWENANRETHSVAQKGDSPLGLFDIYGNVAEWCSDGHCMGGGFLTALKNCDEAEIHGRTVKSPAIGLRIVAFKI